MRNLRVVLLVSRLCLTVFLNHSAHLILHLKFLFLDIKLFEPILLRHSGASKKFTQPEFVGSMFLCEATENRIIGE